MKLWTFVPWITASVFFIVVFCKCDLSAELVGLSDGTNVTRPLGTDLLRLSQLLRFLGRRAIDGDIPSPFTTGGARLGILKRREVGGP